MTTLFSSELAPSPHPPQLDAGLMCPRPKILGYCAPDRCVPTLDRVKHETISVSRYRGLGRPPAQNGSVRRLAGFADAPDQVYWIGAPPSDARSAHT
jgi:hypothetical protein